MQKLLYLFVLTLLLGKVNAQEILGSVKDNKGEPVVNASIAVMQNGKLVGGAISDWDGNYSIKPLPPGNYDMEVTYTGYLQEKLTNIFVPPAGQNKLTITLSPAGWCRVLNTTTVTTACSPGKRCRTFVRTVKYVPLEQSNRPISQIPDSMIYYMPRHSLTGGFDTFVLQESNFVHTNYNK
jgi:hypothetical protein